jgi:hypothetical protein
MTRSAKLRRLHFLNALFAPLTGHDLYLAEQIDAAITSSLAAVQRAETCAEPGQAPYGAPLAPALDRSVAPTSGELVEPTRGEPVEPTRGEPVEPTRGELVEPNDPAYVNAAAQLFGRLCAMRSQHGFFHWDAAVDNAGGSPLFARAGLMAGLKHLAKYSDSTVLVTNLRAAHCPPTKRWTERRRRDYRDTLALLNELAATRTRRNANLNLLFL